MPWILIIVGSIYGSALGIQAQGIMTAYHVRFSQERSCREAEAKINEFMKRTNSKGEAFCVADK